jgi:hypothetical protein
MTNRIDDSRVYPAFWFPFRIQAAPPPASLGRPPKVKLQNIVAIPAPPVKGQIVRNDKKTADAATW